MSDLEARIRILEMKVEALFAVTKLFSQTVEQVSESVRQAELPPPGFAASPPSIRETAREMRQPDLAWFPVIHAIQEKDTAPPGCGDVAYYVNRKIQVGYEKVDTSIMRVKAPGGAQWTAPDINAIPTCSSCGLTINPFARPEMDFSQAQTLPPPLDQIPRRQGKNRASRRAGSAPEARVNQPLTPSGGNSSPGPAELELPEPTLPAAFTPEAEADVVESLSRLAREMGMRGADV